MFWLTAIWTHIVYYAIMGMINVNTKSGIPNKETHYGKTCLLMSCVDKLHGESKIMVEVESTKTVT